jgi:hypothetical protein
MILYVSRKVRGSPHEAHESHESHEDGPESPAGRSFGPILMRRDFFEGATSARPASLAMNRMKASKTGI